ncbi:anti-sigma factor family protein [Streptomyces sp. NPDC054842]
MTSTTGTAGHPDVTELSDLTEGLLPPARSADIRRHLDDCSLCADVHASLEEIRALLGTLPGPSRMPVDVAERIDAALAAEALLSATTPEPEPATPTDERAASAQPDADGSPVSRETSSASAGNRPAGHSRATTGPGRGPRLRRGRRGTIALGAVFTAAVLGLGTLLVQSLTDDNPGDTPATSAQRHTDEAHTFADAKLKKQVADLLAAETSPGTGSKKPWGAASDTSGSGSNEPKTLQETGVPVPECIQQGVNRGDTVLAASEGVYKGTSAYLVVLPHATDPSRVTAYVVDATCVDQASTAKGKVLVTRSYARP